MSKHKYHPLPTRDPVTGGELYVSEMTCEESGVTIRGRFALPAFARLEPEHEQFLEVFLRARGMLNGVERELGISYPTVKARLEALLEALGLEPIKEKKEKVSRSKREVIDALERGEITAEEAKAQLREESSR